MRNNQHHHNHNPEPEQGEEPAEKMLTKQTHTNSSKYFLKCAHTDTYIVESVWLRKIQVASHCHPAKTNPKITITTPTLTRRK